LTCCIAIKFFLNPLSPHLLGKGEKAGFQGAASPWRGSGCPRKNFFSLFAGCRWLPAGGKRSLGTPQTPAGGSAPCTPISERPLPGLGIRYVLPGVSRHQ